MYLHHATYIAYKKRVEFGGCFYFRLSSINFHISEMGIAVHRSFYQRESQSWWYKSGRGFVLKHLWFIVEIRIQGLLLVKLDSTSMQNIGEKEHDCSSFTSTELSGEHRSCLVSTLKVFSKNIRLGLKVYFITLRWEVASGVAYMYSLTCTSIGTYSVKKNEC